MKRRQSIESVAIARKFLFSSFSFYSELSALHNLIWIETIAEMNHCWTEERTFYARVCVCACIWSNFTKYIVCATGIHWPLLDGNFDHKNKIFYCFSNLKIFGEKQKDIRATTCAHMASACLGFLLPAFAFVFDSIFTVLLCITCLRLSLNLSICQQNGLFMWFV